MDEIRSIPHQFATIDEQCQAFSNVLGLKDPVSKEVLFGALNDSTYIHNLLTCRNEPDLLDYLLNNPPTVTTEKSVREKSNMELLKQVSEAVWRWGRTGFSVVDAATLEIRQQACSQCPHLVEPPDQLIYKLAVSKKKRQKICALCGCSVDKKMRLTSESCPAPHPTKAGLTRWQEANKSPQ